MARSIWGRRVVSLASAVLFAFVLVTGASAHRGQVAVHHPARGGCAYYQGADITVDRHGRVYLTQLIPRGGSAPPLENLAILAASGRILRVQTMRPPFGDVAVDGQGQVYLATGAPNQIRKYGRSGRLLATWGHVVPPGPGDYVAVDRHGYVYVVGDWQIEKLTPRGVPVFVRKVKVGPSSMLGPGGFNSVAVDKQGYIYVADMGHQRILKLSPQGRLVATWDARTVHAKSFVPVDVAVDGQGTVYILQVEGFEGPSAARIDVVGSTGYFLGHLPSRWLYDSAALAADARGDVYVALADDRGVLKYSPTAKLVAHWTC